MVVLLSPTDPKNRVRDLPPMGVVFYFPRQLREGMGNPVIDTPPVWMLRCKATGAQLKVWATDATATPHSEGPYHVAWSDGPTEGSGKVLAEDIVFGLTQAV